MELRAVSAEQWDVLEQIVDEALDAAPEAREGIVRARCDADVVMRDAALAWLRACDEGARLLDTPLDAASFEAALHDTVARDSATHDGALDRGGAQVGPWRLLHEIGRGGMGVVYLAERTGGDVRQRIALKFMRHADALDAVGMRRFHDERRILAALAHPAIARLVDVGMDDGIPWLAMEYVAGAPIDAWCDVRALTVEARIELFCQVADAVQHAHARLVVHRDLKPANILVSDDGHPTLLDFGIAKLLDASGLQTGTHVAMRSDLLTRPGLQPMTPAYASPEQKRGESSSTVSDVYALGVLLHALLTGALPTDGIAASTVVRRGTSAAAAQRGTTPARLARRLRGDLDIIIARAIDAEPSRRYATVDAMATDLRRHLKGLPVHARRDSAAYRFRRLVARNPAASIAAALSAVLVVAFTLSTEVQSRRLRAQALVLREQAETLRRERDKATEVTRFLQGVLVSADPYRPGAAVPTLRDVLDRGAVDVERRLGDSPEIRAQLYNAMAPAYFGLGDWARAGDLAQKAVTLRRSVYPPNDAALAASLVYLAGVRLNQTRAAEAETYAREALALFRVLGNGSPGDTLRALSTLGAALQKQGRLAEAGDVHGTLLAAERLLRPLDPVRRAQFTRNLAHVLRDQKRYGEAKALYAEAYAHHIAAFGREHPESANSAVNLGNAYFLTGELESALLLLREGVMTKRRLLGIAHPDVAGDQLTYARALERAGRMSEARQYRAEADVALARVGAGQLRRTASP